MIFKRSMTIRILLFWMHVCGLALGEEQVTRSIVFAELEGTELKLDLYHPQKTTTPSPLIVWVHGGAWRAGNRKSVPIKGLLEKGFAVASVDYRLTTVAPFPANVHDIKAAIRFLRHHAKSYGIDPEMIGIAGASAGGHLAALVGLTNGSKEHEGRIGTNLKTSSDVQAVVSFYGASNLLSILDQSTPHGLKVRVPALKLLLGGTPEEKPDLAGLASPVAQLDRQDPPLLLIHGDQDPQMPFEQSLELQRACATIGKPCELITVKGGQHGGNEFYTNEKLEIVERFLRPALSVD